MKTLLAISVSMLAAGACSAQEKPSFEVASIRPAGGTAFGGSPVGPGTSDPGHFASRNIQMRYLIQQAYGLENIQLIGPSSLDTHWDILATMLPSTTREQLNLMLQRLLDERFHLTFHHQMKEFKAYELVVAKGGVKLRDSIPTDACSSGGAGPALRCGSISQEFGIAKAKGGRRRSLTVPSLGIYTGANIDLAGLALKVRSELDFAPVIDKTGLTGLYDIRMQYAVHDPRTGRLVDEDSPLPTIFDALQQQLGLKLEPTKTMVEMTIVDHIDATPTDN